MRFKIKGARLAGVLLPALALAAPAFAQVRPATLSDATEPGSVIVFPKFINAPAVALPEGGVAPVTELEIGVVCPKGVVCAEHQPVKIRFHWVCGTTEANLAGSFVCKRPTSTSPRRSSRRLCSSPTALPKRLRKWSADQDRARGPLCWRVPDRVGDHADQ